MRSKQRNMGCTRAAAAIILAWSAFVCFYVDCKQHSLRMTFYMHDILTPTNFSQPTAKAVAGPAGANGSSFFGSVVVFDDKVTVSSRFDSTEIGRARGYFVEDAADGQPISVLMAFTVRFTAGAHNGSTLAIFGQDAIAEPRRYLPVVGGTHHFELSRGIALVQTHKLAGALNSVLRFTLRIVCPRGGYYTTLP